MNLTSLAAVAIATTVIFTTTSNADLILSVDFGTTTAVEPGFLGQASASVVHSTSQGDVTVASDGSFFNRGASGSHVDLFRDFTFKNNSNPLTLTLSGPGILANTDYDFKFWTYDSNSGSKGHSQSYAGASGTTGSAGPIAYGVGVPYPAPSSLDSYSALGTFTSDGSGVLTIELTDTITSGNTAQPEPRLNGFQLSVEIVPAPAALPAGLALIGLVAARRRRR